MKLSKMHQRVNAGNFNARHNPPRSVQSEVPAQGHYGKWGWEGPNKADKGERLGSCNVTACQRPGAYWYNKGTDAWYCTECAHGINYRPLDDGTYLYTRDPAAFDEYYDRLEQECSAARSGGKGIDCHRQKAAEIFNVAYEDVTPEQRAAGKNANYLDWYKA